MHGLLLLALLAFSTAVFWAARRRMAAPGPRRNSLPAYYGAWAALWAAAPALLVLIVLSVAGERAVLAVVAADLPAAVEALDAPRRALFLTDALAMGRGAEPTGIWAGPLAEALRAEAAQAARAGAAIDLGGALAVGLLAVTGGLMALRRLRPDLRARDRVERWIEAALLCASAVAVLTTVGIVGSLLWESLRFFQLVSPTEFLFGTHWSPQIAIRADQVGSSGGFGAAPLFVGTFLIMLIAMVVAGPTGLFAAIYLSEYAGPAARTWIKPLLEVLAGVPTVVYGFFAALTVGPAMRGFLNGVGARLLDGPLHGLGLYLSTVQNQMALVAGLVMGIMLIPFVSSLSDDILNAVPQSLRDGALALGSTRSETITRVVLPAALPGVAAAFLLAVSRAIGETMIVTMAAGLQARMTLNPLESVTTVTVQIVTLLTGDQAFDSPKTLSAFGLGLTLFVVTLALNLAAQRVVRHYREQYD